MTSSDLRAYELLGCWDIMFRRSGVFHEILLVKLIKLGVALVHLFLGHCDYLTYHLSILLFVHGTD
jgi:hypothetical protein